MAISYITAGGSNPTACPECKNPNYMRALANPSILSAQTGATLAASGVFHCDNCQHNFSSTNEF